MGQESNEQACLGTLETEFITGQSKGDTQDSDGKSTQHLMWREQKRGLKERKNNW